MNEKIKTESVRIDSDVLERVRSYANNQRLHLSGFISIQLGKVMDKIDKRKSVKNEKV